MFSAFVKLLFLAAILALVSQDILVASQNDDKVRLFLNDLYPTPAPTSSCIKTEMHRYKSTYCRSFPGYDSLVSTVEDSVPSGYYCEKIVNQGSLLGQEDTVCNRNICENGQNGCRAYVCRVYEFIVAAESIRNGSVIGATLDHDYGVIRFDDTEVVRGVRWDTQNLDLYGAAKNFDDQQSHKVSFYAWENRCDGCYSGFNVCPAAPFPSPLPTVSSPGPTSNPSPNPTISNMPTSMPTLVPSSFPTFEPSFLPTSTPSSFPSLIPTPAPTLNPSANPSQVPSPSPSSIPSPMPSHIPTTSMPSSLPSTKPSPVPTTPLPSPQPSSIPSSLPSTKPSPLPTSIPSSRPSFQPTSIPSPVPTTPAPTPTPTFAPTMQIQKIENLHYIIIGVSTFCIFGLTMFVRFDMVPYQQERIGYLNVLVVSFAWLDFIGDLTWTWQRLHAYYIRGEDEGNLTFGIVSAVIMAISIFVMSYNVFFRILLNYRDSIIVEKVQSYSFITMLFIACTDPEVIMFFPWKEDAYKLKMSPFPNDDCVRATLMKLWEDIPEFIVQILYLAIVNFDAFTLLNLIFTMVMLMYFVVGKLLLLFMDPGRSDSVPPSSDVEMNNRNRNIEEEKDNESTSPRAIETRPAQPTRQRSFSIAVELPLVQVIDRVNDVLNEYWDGKRLVGTPQEMGTVLDEIQIELCIANWGRMNIGKKVMCVAHELGIETQRASAHRGQGRTRRYRPYQLVKTEIIEQVKCSSTFAVDLEIQRPWSRILDDLSQYSTVEVDEWRTSNLRNRTHLIADRLFSIQVEDGNGGVGVYHGSV